MKTTKMKTLLSLLLMLALVLSLAACAAPAGNSGAKQTDKPSGDAAVAREAPQGRTKIILAVNKTQKYPAIATEFNKQSATYELVLRDYSEFPNPTEKLISDLGTSSAPDIIDLKSFDPGTVNKAEMTDLMPYLEKDSDIQMKDIRKSFLQAMQTADGKLFAISPYSLVYTMFCHADIKSNVEFKGVIESLKKMGEPEQAFGNQLSKDDFLEMAFCSGEAAKYAKEEIAAILEFAKALPEKVDETGGLSMLQDLHSGKTKFVATMIGEPKMMLHIPLFYFGTENFDEVSAFGVPFMLGSGVLMPQNSFAVPESSAHKDGAWAFIKMMLQKEERDMGFALLKTAEDYRVNEEKKMVESKMFAIDYTDASGKQVSYKPENTEYFEKAEAFLDGVNGMLEPNPELLSIIKEVAKGFFAGEKDAEAAAAEIVSKIADYAKSK